MDKEIDMYFIVIHSYLILFSANIGFHLMDIVLQLISLSLSFDR